MSLVEHTQTPTSAKKSFGGECLDQGSIGKITRIYGYLRGLSGRSRPFTSSTRDTINLHKNLGVLAVFDTRRFGLVNAFVLLSHVC